LGRELPGGSFGENLTTTGIDVNAALIGERWRIGTTVLEVSCPRIPCSTFAGFLDERGWLKRFTLAAVPGPYFRVVEPGHISAGDPITVVSRPAEHRVTVALSFRAVTTEPELLPLLVDVAAFPAEDREAIRHRLAR
jgi:MOSC domain-containing protein YiiM